MDRILPRRNYIIILFLFLISCKKKDDGPVASFDYIATYKYPPDTLAFVNTSSNAESYLWDFGDTTASTEANPVHIYKYPGEFNVKLTARKGDVSNEGTKKVTIRNYPTTFKILKLELEPTLAPLFSNTWDSLDGPDLYFQIIDYTGAWSLYSSWNETYYNATASQLPLSWELNPPLQDIILSPYKPFNIIVYDKDAAGAGDVFFNLMPFGIGGFDPEYYAYPYGNYPSEVILNNSVKLYLEWQ